VSGALSPEQIEARERWQARWNLPIPLTAFIPLFVASPDSRAAEIVVGIGSCADEGAGSSASREVADERSVHEELAALRQQRHAVDVRLAELAERAQTEVRPPSRPGARA
jgi:hypothetical protein